VKISQTVIKQKIVVHAKVQAHFPEKRTDVKISMSFRPKRRAARHVIY
jgi:hypothetical protein